MHIAIKCPRCKRHNDFSTIRVEVLFLQLEAPKARASN
jgi:phage FluMu protein Com